MQWTGTRFYRRNHIAVERTKNVMSQIVVTRLAQAAAAKQIKAGFISGMTYFQWNMNIGMSPLDFADDATSALIAELLDAQVVKVIARSVWMNGDPNNPTLKIGVPLQNYAGFAGQPGAPSPNSLLIVNMGDIACAAVQGYYFLPEEIAVEQVLGAPPGGLIPGAVMSDAAVAAMNGSPVASWPVRQPTWYTPTA